MSDQGKGNRKRKRTKLECLVCHQLFDDDFRKTHNRKQHYDLIKQKKLIGYKVANAPRNPFEAAKKSKTLDEGPASALVEERSNTTEGDVSGAGTSGSGSGNDMHRPDKSDVVGGIPRNEENVPGTGSDTRTRLAENISHLDLNVDCGSRAVGEDSDDCTRQTTGCVVGEDETPEVNSMDDQSNEHNETKQYRDQNIRNNSDDEDDDISELEADKNLDWLTCAGQLAQLSTEFKTVDRLLENVRGDNCPLVETFLTEVKEVTAQIRDKSRSICQNASVLLRDMQEGSVSPDDGSNDSFSCSSKVPSYDPGDRHPITLDSERKYLINVGPHQPKLQKFPSNRDIPTKKQNKFSSTWYSAYPHLEYSIKTDAAYCFACSMFPPAADSSAEKAWSTQGVRQWHKMQSRGKGKKGKLAEHFGSVTHRNAMKDFIHFCRESSHIDVLLDKAKRLKLIEERQDQVANRDAVAIIMDIERTLARQGLPFRGSSSRGDGTEELDGNFHQIVQLVGRHNHVMRRWLDDKRMRPYQVTYMSPDAQNEMINLLADQVKERIRTDVERAGLFAVMTDTTPDTSNKDRLAVAVRYVNESGAVKERLLEVKETVDKTGAGQAADILVSLEESGIGSTGLAFQSYDFASNMSGRQKGAQAEIEKALHRKVPYIPCQAHRTNTVVEHACGSSPLIRELFDMLQEVYVFFSGSTKRHGVLSARLETVEDALNLRNLSKTRWSARAESIQAVWRSLEALMGALQDIISAPATTDRKVVANATGLYRKLHSFDFVASLMFMKNIMVKTNRLTVELQNEELNIVDALDITKATVMSLERAQTNDEEINAQVTAAVSVAEKLGIHPQAEFARIHRARRPPGRIDENADNAATLNFHQFYRKEFKCVLDSLVSGFKSRMQPTLKIIAPLDRVLGIPFTISSTEDVEGLVSMFTWDVDVDALAAELELFKPLVEENAVCTTSAAAQLAYRYRGSLPLMWKAYQLLLTAPITVAKDERAFSHLKFVKNVYRSTMVDSRLDGLLIMNCEKDFTDSIDIDAVMKRWASKPRR